MIGAEEFSAAGNQGVDVLVFVAQWRIGWQIGKNRCCGMMPTRAESRVEFFGDGQQVIAAIAVLRENESFTAGFEIAQPYGYSEDLGLSARVVDVVLAGDIVARSGEQAAKRIAEGGLSAMTHVHRAGRVGRDELQQYLASNWRVVATVLVALAMDAQQLLGE